MMAMKKIKFCIVFSCLFHCGLQSSYSAPPAGLAGTLSIIPGLGQAVSGEPLEGLGWFSSVVGLSVMGGDFAQIGFNIWMYNMYDAYRDAKPQIGRYKDHSVYINYLGAWNPLNIIDPIGAPIVAYGAYAGSRRGFPGLRSVRKPIIYSFVGLGEEAIFRGFLFPAFSDLFSSTLAGALTSSAVFSVAHVTGGRENLSSVMLAQRFVFGLLFCWQASRNQYDLRKSIFAHAWYDVFVDPGNKVGLEIKFVIP